MTYDPELIDRLAREARVAIEAYRRDPWRMSDPVVIAESYARLTAMADQLEAARREVERLTGCMDVAGLQCFMRSGAPEQVAEHMRMVVASWIEKEAKLTSERELVAPVVEAADRYVYRGGAVLPLKEAIDAYRGAKGKT